MLVLILRVLRLLDNMELFLPETGISPVEMLKLKSNMSGYYGYGLRYGYAMGYGYNYGYNYYGQYGKYKDADAARGYYREEGTR